MSVSRINHNGICTGVNQCLHALNRVDSNAHTGSHAQPTFCVFTSHRFVFCFRNVFISNQAYQLTVFIHNRQFFNLVFLQDARSRFHVGSLFGGNDVFFRHHLVDTFRHVFFETQVTVCYNTYQIIFVIYHRNTADFIFSHDSQRIFYG